MHPASAFREVDHRELLRFVRNRSFASIIGVNGVRAIAASAPVLISDKTARFHLSSCNPLTPVLTASRLALAIVSGDDAYVSPDWYASADQVPTWNYLSVEIEGHLRVLGRDETSTMLDELSAQFEATLAPKPPWTKHKMRREVFDAMLGGITGFEMKVHRIEGTIKLSQNKPPAEIARVAAALAARPDSSSQAISGLMTARIATPPSTTPA